MLRTVLIAAALFAAAAPACAQDLKVGFIDPERLAKESPQGKKVMSTLKREFAPREQEILRFQAQIKETRDRFEQEQSTLSEQERAERWKPIAEMMKKSDRMVYQWQEEAKLRRNEIMSDFVRERNEAINAVIKAESYDLVVEKALFSSNRIDITDRVLAEMAKRAGSTGP